MELRAFSAVSEASLIFEEIVSLPTSSEISSADSIGSAAGFANAVVEKTVAVAIKMLSSFFIFLNSPLIFLRHRDFIPMPYLILGQLSQIVKCFLEITRKITTKNMNKFAIFGTARSDFGDMVGFQYLIVGETSAKPKNFSGINAL